MPPLTHAELGASSAHRWMNCGGSVALSRQAPPDEGSAHAEEGTAAHALAEKCLKGRIDPYTFVGTSIKGYEVTDEMAEAVEMYVQEVQRVFALDPKSELWIERVVSLAPLQPPVAMYGTCDAMVWLPSLSVLYVIDFKYGQGVVVDVVDNEQLMFYGLGGMLMLEQEQPGTIVERVNMTIVQPRAMHSDGPVRAHEESYESLLAFALRLLAAAHDALDEGAKRVPGEHCRWCRAKAICPDVHARAQEIARVEFAQLPILAPPAPTSLTITEVAALLGKVDLIEDWIRSLRDYVKSALERGEEVPGWKLVAKRANRKWADEDEVRRFVREQGFTDSEMSDLKLKSVAQMEKMLKKAGLEVPPDLWTKPNTGHALAPSDDARPAIASGPEADFAKPTA